jgi:hypothetical protein
MKKSITEIYGFEKSDGEIEIDGLNKAINSGYICLNGNPLFIHSQSDLDKLKAFVEEMEKFTKEYPFQEDVKPF